MPLVETEMTVRSEGKLFMDTSKSLVELVFDLLKRMRATLSSFVDSIAFWLKPDVKKPVEEQKEPKREVIKSNQKSYWKDGLGNELLREWEEWKKDMVGHIQRLQIVVVELLAESELRDVVNTLGQMLSTTDYLVFFFGTIVTFLLPKFWPFVGLMFFKGIGLVLWLCGNKNARLLKLLNWEKAPETIARPTATEEQQLQEMSVEEDNASEIPASLPQLVVTSEEEVESINPKPTEETCQTKTVQQNMRLSSSDTTKDVSRKEREARRISAKRREELGIPPSYSVQDIRRLAPPVDAHTAVKGIILELEQQRRSQGVAKTSSDEDLVEEQLEDSHGFVYDDNTSLLGERIKEPLRDHNAVNQRPRSLKIGGSRGEEFAHDFDAEKENDKTFETNRSAGEEIKTITQKLKLDTKVVGLKRSLQETLSLVDSRSDSSSSLPRKSLV